MTAEELKKKLASMSEEEKQELKEKLVPPLGQIGPFEWNGQKYFGLGSANLKHERTIKVSKRYIMRTFCTKETEGRILFKGQVRNAVSATEKLKDHLRDHGGSPEIGMILTYLRKLAENDTLNSLCRTNTQDSEDYEDYLAEHTFDNAERLLEHLMQLLNNESFRERLIKANEHHEQVKLETEEALLRLDQLYKILLKSSQEENQVTISWSEVFYLAKADHEAKLAARLDYLNTRLTELKKELQELQIKIFAYENPRREKDAKSRSEWIKTLEGLTKSPLFSNLSEDKTKQFSKDQAKLEQYHHRSEAIRSKIVKKNGVATDKEMRELAELDRKMQKLTKRLTDLVKQQAEVNKGIKEIIDDIDKLKELEAELEMEDEESEEIQDIRRQIEVKQKEQQELRNELGRLNDKVDDCKRIIERDLNNDLNDLRKELMNGNMLKQSLNPQTEEVVIRRVGRIKKHLANYNGNHKEYFVEQLAEWKPMVEKVLGRPLPEPKQLQLEDEEKVVSLIESNLKFN